MDEEAAASDTDGVIHGNEVTIGTVDGNADAARIHDHGAFLGQNGVSADRRRIVRATHRSREHPRLSPVRSVVRRRKFGRRSRVDADNATVLCAGQYRSGTQCTTLLSSHSNFPTIAGTDLMSRARSAARLSATG